MNKTKEVVGFSHKPISKSSDPTWGCDPYFGNPCLRPLSTFIGMPLFIQLQLSGLVWMHKETCYDCRAQPVGVKQCRAQLDVTLWGQHHEKKSKGRRISWEFWTWKGNFSMYFLWSFNKFPKLIICLCLLSIVSLHTVYSVFSEATIVSEGQGQI